MQTTSLSLGELLERARAGKLTIPQFQRQFIWRQSQVKLLIDSMSRSYPIGSLLLLNKTSDLQLGHRSIEAQIREDIPTDSETHEGSSSDVESYILDGQQRATSIARVFLNSDPEKLYYFDLKKIYDEYEREGTAWIKIRRRGKTETDRKDNNRLLRADVALDQKKSDVYVTEYIEDSEDFPDFDKKQARVAAARIKGIFETVRNYKIPVVTLDRDSGIESVCRIFETINSTGTRLTTFDLAVARFYPSPDLRDLWNKALEQHPTLKEFEVDGERVLQTLYIANATREEKYPDPTRTNLLSLTGDKIRSQWEKSANALADTYNWARAYGARPKTLPNHNVLVALAAIRCLDKWYEVEKNHDFIKRWYFSKVMQAGASQASNYRIAQDFNALWEYVQNKKQPEVMDVVLDIDVVLKLKPSDVRYKALQNIFSMTARQSLISGNQINSDSMLHDHHIFPSNAHRRHKLPRELLDGICNRVPILENENLSLGESYPEKYFYDMAKQAREQGTLDGLSRRLKEYMIPGDPRGVDWNHRFRIGEFENFCRSRAELVIARVQEVVGDSLRKSPTSEEEEEEYID